MYGAALEGYSRAAALNPGWDEPVEKEKQLLDYLRKVTNLMENKVETHAFLMNRKIVSQVLLVSNTNAKKMLIIYHHHSLHDSKVNLTALMALLSYEAEKVNQSKNLIF